MQMNYRNNTSKKFTYNNGAIEVCRSKVLICIYDAFLLDIVNFPFSQAV